MKKLFAILVTVALVVCSAGPVMAAFYDNQNLMMVVYNNTDNEVAIDLGNYDTVDYSVAGQTLAAAGSVNPAGAQFGSAVDSWDDLHVGLFTANRTSGVYHFVLGTTQNTRNPINSAAKANFYTQSSNTHNTYRAAGEQVVTGSASYNYSYSTLLDAGAYGQMAGYNPYNASLAGPDLGALLTDGFIDLFLYEYDINGNLVAGNGVDYQGIIRLNANGSVVTVAGGNPVVPIPGALVLFASGLVGLIGIRRKNS